MSFIHHYSKHLKVVLALVICISLIAIVTVFGGYRNLSSGTKPLIGALQKNVTLSLRSVRQVATKNGAMEWCLNAKSAQYFNDRKQADFNEPSVTFFLNADEAVHMTAAKGTVLTESNDIRAKGNVVVRNGSYELQTESLLYNNQNRTFSSADPVKIKSTEGDIFADKAAYDLETGKATFTGNIRGIFNVRIRL
jgi:LPS export ABC transporter protein LptC